MPKVCNINYIYSDMQPLALGYSIYVAYLRYAVLVGGIVFYIAIDTFGVRRNYLKMKKFTLIGRGRSY